MGSTDDWFQANGTGVDNSFGATGSGSVAFTNSFSAPPPFDVGAMLVGAQYGVMGQAFFTNDTDWPPPDSYSANASVFGPSTEFTGVAGISTWGTGVYGHRSAPGDDPSLIPNGLPAAVVGTGINWDGVIGWSTNGNGVEGVTFDGEGGVVGVGGQAPGVFGVSFAPGPTVPNTSNIAAVVGKSDSQHGVLGSTNANVGVIGFSTNNIGVLGYTTNGSFAGYFLGDLGVTGAKAAVVPFPDGTHRALYCMESPDLWFEDFGAAKLKRGRAVVPLDTDFAKVIKRGDYRVFLTPEGDCRGLYVRRKSAASFEVRELMGGESSIAFSYRIVGRRKDIKGHRRFAKIDTRLPLPSPLRKPAPTAAARAFVARVEREARARRPKAAKKRRQAGGPRQYLRPRSHIVAPPRPPDEA
jgi:hypothetical protein